MYLLQEKTKHNHPFSRNLKLNNIFRFYNLKVFNNISILCSSDKHTEVLAEMLSNLFICTT